MATKAEILDTHWMLPDLEVGVEPGTKESDIPMICTRCGLPRKEAEKTACKTEGM